MAEYIEREAATELLQGPITMSMCLTTDECQNKRDQRAIDLALIKSIPAADVAPVRHGRWVKEIFNDGYGDYPLYVCSECRAQSARKRNYCYDCGAKMEETE